MLGQAPPFKENVEEKVSIDEERDLLKLLGELTSLVQIRNAAKIQSQQGPLEDRKAWKQLYRRCIVEIQETENEISVILPSNAFQRRLFIAIG